MKWTDETFNLMPLPEHVIKQIFVPLTDEEMRRLPPLWEKSECKPSQELLPCHPEPTQQRILKPTRGDIMALIPTKRSSDNTEGHYCISNTQLDSVDSVKYLGVNIDHKLNFKNHSHN